MIPLARGGSVYSFSEGTHVQSDRSELGLEDGQLRSGFAGTVLGLLVNLGDEPIDSVNLDSPGVNYLAKFQAPRRRTDAAAQYKRNAVGFTFDNYFYRTILPATPGTTYALRSVADRRADILVLFRVVRQDQDGSIVLAWKRLQKFPTAQFGSR